MCVIGIGVKKFTLSLSSSNHIYFPINIFLRTVYNSHPRITKSVWSSLKDLQHNKIGTLATPMTENHWVPMSTNICRKSTISFIMEPISQLYKFTESTRKAKNLTSKAFVPLSIKSIFVNTPNVRSPKLKIFWMHSQEKTQKYYEKINAYFKHECEPNAASIPAGSTCLETLTASDVATSWFAGVMAKIKQLGCN